MSDWDLGGVFCNDLNLPGGDDSQNGGQSVITPEIAQRKFREFIRTFRRVNSNVFEYREKLLRNVRRGIHAINVNLKDLKFFGLQDLVMERPGVFLAEFEKAAQSVAKDLVKADEEIQNIQITLSSEQECIPIRHINASHVNTLVKLPGICISAARTKPKATSIFIKCRSCSHGMMLKCQKAFGAVQMPRQCQAEKLEGEQKCPLDPYVVIPDRCKYIDTQVLKLQEAPESVPTGEMPRHVRTLSHHNHTHIIIITHTIYRRHI